jgi:spermidine synthase
MRIPLAAVGFTSIIAQIVLMRELVATFYGNELLFGLVLMAWLAWVALGSWGLARLAIFRRLREKAFAVGLLLAGILLLAQITLVRNVRGLLDVTPGAFVEFGPMVLAVALMLAPLCVLTGFLFTLGARLTVERSGAVGQAYAWESIGAVVGGALFSFALVRWLDPFQTALLVGAASLAVAVYLLQEPPLGVSRILGGGRQHSLPLPSLLLKFGIDLPAQARGALAQSIIVFAALVAVGLPLGSYLHQVTLRWQWSHLVFAADSAYGRLIIQARDGQRVFFENGLLAFETQGTFPEEVAHFPLLAHPDPRNVLLIGGGVAGDLREILKHPVTRVTYVELDPLLIKAARAHLPPEDAAVLNDPRANLILTDGRLYVKQASDASQSTRHRDGLLNGPDAPFDVVILDLPEPSTGALNRFYTREFFAEVKAILSPGGIFALGLPSAENYWSQELARRNGSVYHTLRAVFPEVLVLPGEHNFFLASDLPVEADPAIVAGRLSGRGVETRWVTADYIRYIFTTDRFQGVQRELEATTGVRLNRDLTPICYYYDLALWLSRFYPNLPGAVGSTKPINLGWVVVPLALGVVWVRWRRGLAVPVAMAAIGLAGMTLELVILFAFQVLHGYLYAQVSLILTAFMAGLWLGAVGSNRLLSRWPSSPEKRARLALMGIQLVIAVYSVAFVVMLRWPIPAPTLVFPLLALLAGVLGGMAFPLAVVLVRRRGSAGRVAGMLYGADLVGGCLGALLGAVLFIPVLGIPLTCVVVALVALAGVLALV